MLNSALNIKQKLNTGSKEYANDCILFSFCFVAARLLWKEDCSVKGSKHFKTLWGEKKIHILEVDSLKTLLSRQCGE